MSCISTVKCQRNVSASTQFRCPQNTAHCTSQWKSSGSTVSSDQFSFTCLKILPAGWPMWRALSFHNRTIEQARILQKAPDGNAHNGCVAPNAPQSVSVGFGLNTCNRSCLPSSGHIGVWRVWRHQRRDEQRVFFHTKEDKVLNEIKPN